MLQLRRVDKYIKELNQSIRFYCEFDTETGKIGTVAPSVTSVIGSAIQNHFLDNLVKIHGKEWLSIRADIGTAVHALIDNYIRTGEDDIAKLLEVVRFDLGITRSFERYEERQIIESFAHFITYPAINSPGPGVLTERSYIQAEPFPVAGTIDYIDTQNGVLIDFKNGEYKAISNSHKLQLAGYAFLSHDEISEARLVCPAKSLRSYDVREYVMLKGEVLEYQEKFEVIYNLIDWSKIIDSAFEKPEYLGKDFKINTEKSKKKDNENNYRTFKEYLESKFILEV